MSTPSTRAIRVRTIVRDCVAFSFWMHAAYVSSLLVVNAVVSPNWPRYLYNATILSFIFFYSFCGESGWLSVAIDALYVYFWPFIITSKIAWFSIKGSYLYLRKKLVWTSPSLILPQPAKAQVVQGDVKEKKDSTNSSSVEIALKPFRQFIVLWAALILSFNNKFFIALAVTVALVGTGRAIYRLWNILSDTSSWIEKVKDNFARQIADNIRQVTDWTAGSSLDEVTKAANSLKSLEAIFTFISVNRDFLSKSTMVVAALISIPFYCYVSFLFSCVYVGLGKLQNIPFAWPSALIDSLYMPFAFSNLPSNVAIQFLGGLQALVVTFIGWNIFFRHLGDRFIRITKAATELRSPFQDALFKEKLGLIESASTRVEVVEMNILTSVMAETAHSEVEVVPCRTGRETDSEHVAQR